MLRLGMLRLRTLRRRLWLGYSRDDLVLDVGSGHRPHPRSDVLCDRHLRDDRERLGPLVMDRPLVIGDLTALPFRDRCVGFLICQHVLEHVDDPARALDEMMRVARAGYIETPAPLWERLVGRPYHHWLVSRQGSRIICSAKPEGVPDRDLLAAFERFARSGSAWAELTLEQFDHFYTAYFWRDRIEYEVRGVARSETRPALSMESPEEGEDCSISPRRDAGPGRVKALALKLLRVLLAPPRKIDLESIIACPSCHGTLARVGDGYHCVLCRLRYPIRGGVPVLLRSEATSIAPPAAGETAPDLNGENGGFRMSLPVHEVLPECSLPTVSVLMAVRNEEHHIADALEAVRGQDYPPDRLEIVVADGDSDDRTREIVRCLADRDPRVKLLRNPSRFVAAGLNAAIREARGEVVVRVDGHCALPPNYISTCVDLLAPGTAEVAGGPVRALGEGALGRAIALAMSTPFGVGGASFRWSRDDGEPRFVAHVPFLACRRELFDRVGLFDERLVRNQDDEFSDRVARSGGRILMDPRIVVDYWSRTTLRGLWRQYFGYGYWKVAVIRKRGGVPSSWRHLVPAGLVLGLAGALVDLLLTGRGQWLALTAGSYLAFLAVATAWTALRRRDSAALLLPVVLPVLHLAYGIGFLAALGAALRPWPPTPATERARAT